MIGEVSGPSPFPLDKNPPFLQKSLELVQYLLIGATQGEFPLDESGDRLALAPQALAFELESATKRQQTKRFDFVRRVTDDHGSLQKGVMFATPDLVQPQLGDNGSGRSLALAGVFPLP